MTRCISMATFHCNIHLNHSFIVCIHQWKYRNVAEFLHILL